MGSAGDSAQCIQKLLHRYNWAQTFKTVPKSMLFQGAKLDSKSCYYFNTLYITNVVDWVFIGLMICSKFLLKTEMEGDPWTALSNLLHSSNMLEKYELEKRNVLLKFGS